ncbi:hypothetical protein ES703_58306 [subsurface metagenome]
MQKQYVRKMQKIGNGLGVRISPELCQEADVGRGDNVSLEFNPETGGLKLGKVAQANPGLDDVQQQDETHEIGKDKSNENKSNENESRVDLADEKEQGQQDEIKKTEFCPSCGSDDIRQVTGNQFYCGDCELTYEMTPKGAKVVKGNPGNPASFSDLVARVEELENGVDKLNDKSVKDKNSGGFLSRFFGTTDEDDEDDILNQGFIRFESEDAHVAVGAGENPGSDDDDDDDDDGQFKPFITW